MNLDARVRNWAWRLAALVVVLAVVGVGFGLGRAATPPALWTDQPVVTGPVATVPAPDWVRLAKALKPAVVNISTKRVEESSPGPAPRLDGADPFERFFGPFVEHGRPRTVKSLGSGAIISADGHIITNNHVIEGATEIRVKLADGRDVTARAVGRDPKTDLALLKIEATGLPVVPLGDSSALEVGEPVMAIGNPFGLEQTVTTGIVSATGRVIGDGPYDDFIQTDTSINPGNSGGPLINARGQAIGINTAIFSQSGGSIGIGFAIPVNVAKSVVTQLARTGHVVRGWLGVTIQPVTADLAKSFHLPDASGALVSSVLDDSPARRAGLAAGDVIVQYDGRKIASADELPRAVAATPVDREVSLTAVRDGKPLTLKAKVGQLAEVGEPATGGGKSTPSLGLMLQPLTPELARQLGVEDKKGVLVRDVANDSPAANAGLRQGDVIVEVDRHSVQTVDEIKSALVKHPKDGPILFLVHRHGARIYLTVTS